MNPPAYAHTRQRSRPGRDNTLDARYPRTVKRNAILTPQWSPAFSAGKGARESYRP